MYIVADSGSTKCAWALVGGTKQEVRITRGINPVLQGREEVLRLLREAFPERQTVQALWFYGAGCGERYPAQTEMLCGALEETFDCGGVEIASDLLGAARALFGDGTGIACILGTGSNSCYYERGRIVCNVPSLGYILGDEGGGAAIGRMLAGDLLKGLLPRRLLDDLYLEEGLSFERVMQRVYGEPMPNRFLASLVPFAARHIDEPEIKVLVERAFGEFVLRNLAGYPRHVEIACMGGVAHAFAPQLSKVLERNGWSAVRIERSPLDGLVKYHGRETDNGTDVVLR